MSNRIGVYVCHCGSNIAGKIDVQAVANSAKLLPEVKVSRDYVFMCSEPGQQLILDDIRKYDLNRIVVAACSPLMHEKTFRDVVVQGGLNPYLVNIANIREHCSWVTEDPDRATEKARALIAAAVAKVRFLKPLKQTRVIVNQSILVVGGGISGIQAALQCADSGFKVYLVEREQSIGGHMAMLDKTFPTLDCSACILTPKMVSVGKHPNIHLMTYSEVEKVSGFVGNFKIRVRRKATYVDFDKCTGCGICQDKCPVKTGNAFELNKTHRKAIYTLFPQAVPNKPVIDPEHCIHFTQNKCGACQKLCPKQAIDFAQQDVLEDIQVGAIIVTTGHQVFDSRKMPAYGYGKLSDVYNALEFERMVNSGGFTQGKIITSGGKAPERVGIIHCVGSRDQRHNDYCSQICCMYALKFAHLVRDHTGAHVYNFYIDIRCVGKGYEEFYDRVLSEGVFFIRGKVASITRPTGKTGSNGQLNVLVEDTLAGIVRRIPLDMVILANGIEAKPDSREVARIFGISTNKNGFFLEQHPKLNPFGTHDPCVFIAGTCAGPKDIPHSVAQASAAAAAAITLLEKATIPIESYTARVMEELCAGCQTCIRTCPYDAIKYDPDKKAPHIDEGLCRGCGTCASACPSGAIETHNFTDRQIMEEIQAILS